MIDVGLVFGCGFLFVEDMDDEFVVDCVKFLLGGEFESVGGDVVDVV